MDRGVALGILNNPPWLCPAARCGHGLVLHDWCDDGPMCCVEGCDCRPGPDTSDLFTVECGRAGSQPENPETQPC